jgi:ubiquinone/menaquinone biosynthesis C-methylase UbiE
MGTDEAIAPYSDGRLYDLLNAEIVEDIPFYTDEARSASGPVLELSCGTGRLTIPIAKSGVEIVRLDVTASMLAHAREKARSAGVRSNSSSVTAGRLT